MEIKKGNNRGIRQQMLNQIDSIQRGDKGQCIEQNQMIKWVFSCFLKSLQVPTKWIRRMGISHSKSYLEAQPCLFLNWKWGSDPCSCDLSFLLVVYGCSISFNVQYILTKTHTFKKAPDNWGYPLEMNTTSHKTQSLRSMCLSLQPVYDAKPLWSGKKKKQHDGWWDISPVFLSLAVLGAQTASCRPLWRWWEWPGGMEWLSHPLI